MEIHTYGSVWDAIADGPEEATNLKLRSQLMDAIEAYIAREGITQEEAARRLGVPRSRLSELVNGRISKFTIDKLVNMAARVGLATEVKIGQKRRRSRSQVSKATRGLAGNVSLLEDEAKAERSAYGTSESVALPIVLAVDEETNSSKGCSRPWRRNPVLCPDSMRDPAQRGRSW